MGSALAEQLPREPCSCSERPFEQTLISKCRDAFNKREKANEDLYMKNKEREKYV